MSYRQYGRVVALSAVLIGWSTASSLSAKHPAPPAPRLIWAFNGENERASTTLPDSEAIEVVIRHGFVEGKPRGPRFLAFDGAGQLRCAVALDSTASVIASGAGQTVVLAAGTADFLNERCTVRYSHPAGQAACLLDGGILAVADEGQLLFLDEAGSTRAAANLPETPTLIASADGGHLVAAGTSLRIYDPWGRQTALIELASTPAAPAIAGGPDRIYVATTGEQSSGRARAPEGTSRGNDVDEVLAVYTLDGTLVTKERIMPEELDVTGMWAWPDGRGALVILAEREPGSARLRGHRLEARSPDGKSRWQIPLAESGQPARLEVSLASTSGDVAITISDAVGSMPRAAILVVAPDGRVRALLRVTAIVREGGARLSAGGRYLLVNATDSGLLTLYTVP